MGRAIVRLMGMGNLGLGHTHTQKIYNECYNPKVDCNIY